MNQQNKTPGYGIGTFLRIWIVTTIILGAIFAIINRTGQSSGTILFGSMSLGFFLTLIIMVFLPIIRTLRKLKNQEQINSVSENLNDNQMVYTGQQASNDMRIISESIEIMETTSDIDTFLLRYEIAMKCALTLEQAKKAGIPIALQDNISQSLTSAKNEALVGVLYRSLDKELNEISKLKTERGQLDRINRYQNKLKDIYEDVFKFVADDAYNDVMQKLEFLKNGK